MQLESGFHPSYSSGTVCILQEGVWSGASETWAESFITNSSLPGVRDREQTTGHGPRVSGPDAWMSPGVINRQSVGEYRWMGEGWGVRGGGR